MNGALHTFMKLGRHTQNILLEIIKEQDDDTLDSLSSARFMLETFEDCETALRNPRPELDMEFIAEMKSVTGRVLRGDPYIILSFPNVVEETALNEAIELFGPSEELETEITIGGMELYTTLYLMDEIEADYIAIDTGELVILIAVFEEGETKLLKMQKKKTGTSQGVVFVSPKDKKLPTLRVVTKADLDWVKENKQEGEDVPKEAVTPYTKTGNQQKHKSSSSAGSKTSSKGQKTSQNKKSSQNGNIVHFPKGK